VWLLAAAYVRYGQLPPVAGVLYGVKPVVIAVVAQALWGLGRTAVKSRALAVLAVAAVALVVAGANELVVLFGVGLVAALGRGFARHGVVAGAVPLPALGLAAGAAAATPVHLPGVFLSFLKIGSILFGSGYVLLAFLRAEFVARLGWLTEGQLLDAVAVGQVTPGPLFTTATFVGYVLGGHTGAALATGGIFLPAFFFVAVSGPLVPRLRRSKVAGAFLDGVNVASLALMAAVTGQLAWGAVRDVPTALLALASAVLLLRFRVNATWLVAGGALVGLMLHLTS
jgi:chromate transporter